MSEGRPIRLDDLQLGMPKMAKRVWPYEEGMQPGFWKREEEFTNRNTTTSLEHEVLMRQCIEEMTELSELWHSTPGSHSDDLLGEIDTVLNAYQINIKELYTAHQKAIREIKDRYPGVR